MILCCMSTRSMPQILFSSLSWSYPFGAFYLDNPVNYIFVICVLDWHERGTLQYTLFKPRCFFESAPIFSQWIRVLLKLINYWLCLHCLHKSCAWLPLLTTLTGTCCWVCLLRSLCCCEFLFRYQYFFPSLILRMARPFFFGKHTTSSLATHVSVTHVQISPFSTCVDRLCLVINWW